MRRYIRLKALWIAVRSSECKEFRFYSGLLSIYLACHLQLWELSLWSQPGTYDLKHQVYSDDLQMYNVSPNLSPELQQALYLSTCVYYKHIKFFMQYTFFYPRFCLPYLTSTAKHFPSSIFMNFSIQVHRPKAKKPLGPFNFPIIFLPTPI